ncbi:MAG: 4Fe-4S dicluster domain-containing protein [Candidatus Lokiarchaeota archaeon]|nr:4Fe-4S dicluster domain-containing protein [Candidatus Lokiarchaeota archaeon]
MFPKIHKERDKNLSRVKLQFLTNSVALEVNEDVCQGCGICIKVCPKQAMERGPVGDSKRNNKEDVIPTLVDPKECSYCGLCSYMCPWNAITLYKDDEKVELDDLDIVKHNAVPELEVTMRKCKDGVEDAKSYLEGEIEFKTENCAGGCNTCIEVCPTGALTLEKPDAPWDKGRKIIVDKDKCIYCGTCTNACPVFDAIKLTIKEVKTKGKYNEIFWNPVVERLKISRMRDGKKIN